MYFLSLESCENESMQALHPLRAGIISHWWRALVKVLLVKYLKLVMFRGSQSSESDDFDSESDSETDGGQMLVAPSLDLISCSD